VPLGFVGHISTRFLKSRSSKFLSLIAIFAGMGITISVMVLDVTLAVMNGFRDQIQVKFVENMPMVTVLSREGFDDLEGLLVELRERPEVTGAAPFLRSESILGHERIPGRPIHRGTVLWGIRSGEQDAVTPFSAQVSPPFEDFTTDGFLGGGPDLPGIVLGVELANGLRAGVGDVVALFAPRKTGTGAQDYTTETREFMVIGILDSGMYEFDVAFSYIDLGIASQMFGRSSPADGIGLRLVDMMDAQEVADQLESELGYPRYFTNDWIRLNSQLFEWIQMEKALMFLLLTFLSLVASFSVVAILTMMVRDRQRDLGVLMSLGVGRRRLVGIFVQLGLVLGAAGTFLGSLLGLVMVVLLDRIGFPLPGDVLFVDTLPVHATAGDFLVVAATSLVLTFLATLLPSWLASRLTPVEVLRYE
jgi:lipoprotein-releasing system permease protein